MGRWDRKKDKEPEPPEGMDVSKALAMRTDLTLKKRRAFLKVIQAGGTVVDACAAGHISRTTAYEWRNTDTDFQQAWAEAELACIEEAEAEALRRGKAKSDLLLMFWLKAHKPEVYREVVRNEQTGRNGGPIESAGTLRIIIESAPETGPIPPEPE